MTSLSKILDKLWSYPEKYEHTFNEFVSTFLKLRPFSYIFVLLIAFTLIGTTLYANLLNFKFHNYSDTLKVGFLGSVNDVNPYPYSPIIEPLQTSDRIINKLIFDRLIDTDQLGNKVNDLVDNYSSSTDFKTFSFQLKSNIKWSDGYDFNSDDVIQSFNLIRSEPTNLYYTSLNDITVNKIDDYQIEFKLNKGNYFFPDTLNWPIVPAHIFTTNEKFSTQLAKLNFRSNPVTTGPWVVNSRTKDSLILSQNPYYQREKANFSFINFKSFEAESEIQKSISSQDIDLYFANDTEDISSKVALQKPVQVLRQYYALYFNLEDNGPAWAKDVNVRKALAFGINKAELLGNGLQRIDGPLPSQSPYYYSDINKYDYSTDTAGKDLDAAGYKLVNGQRQKDGKQLELTLSVQDDTPRVPIAEKIQQYWEALGIKVNLNKQEDNTVLSGEIINNTFATNVILPRNFDIVLYGVETPPNWDRYSLWHSPDAKLQDSNVIALGNNISGYKNTKVDINLENARLDTDETKRKADFVRFQRLLTDDVPAIFLYNPTINIVYSKRVKNFNTNIIYSPEDLFLVLNNVQVEI